MVKPRTEASKKTDRTIAYRGINLAGAEFGNWNNSNTEEVHWRWPRRQEYEYLASRGHKLIRLPYLWERLQPDLTKSCNRVQLQKLDQAIIWAGQYGMKVMIDNHNYASYKGVKFAANGGPTEAQFVAHWVELSERYKNNPTVVGYGLMNEPNSIPTADLGDGAGSLTGQLRWYKLAQAAVTAIRANDDATVIAISGYSSSPMASWLSNTPGLGNKYITKYVKDPINNLVFECHHYSDGSGAFSIDYATANAATPGYTDKANADAIIQFELVQWHAMLDWAQEHGVRVYLGEIGFPRVIQSHTQPEVDKWNILQEEIYSLLDAYGTTVWGITAWATGTKWSATYPLNYYLHDGTSFTGPAEQCGVLERHPTFYADPPQFSGYSSVRQGTQLRGQNFPLELTGSQGSMVTGQVYATSCNITVPGTLARVSIAVVTNGSGPVAGQCFVALYDSDSGEQIAISGDIGSQLLTAGLKNIDLTTRTRVFKIGENVRAAILWNGTTPPILAKASINTTFANTTKYGISGTGAIAMPASIPPNALTAPTQTFWMGVSGY